MECERAAYKKSRERKKDGMGWDGREKTEKGKGMTAVGEEKKGRQNGGKREYESEIKARKGKGKEQR